MSCTVIPPKFVSEQGSQGYYTRVSKPGVLLLEFAMRNKDGPESNDVRSYDWENKVWNDVLLHAGAILAQAGPESLSTLSPRSNLSYVTFLRVRLGISSRKRPGGV